MQIKNLNRRFSFVEKSVKRWTGDFADYTIDELEAVLAISKKRGRK